jgi:hypothetical protein
LHDEIEEIEGKNQLNLPLESDTRSKNNGLLYNEKETRVFYLTRETRNNALRTSQAQENSFAGTISTFCSI